MFTHQHQQTQLNKGFDLFQERLTEYAEFIVTDLQTEAVRHRWLELPERVRHEYAAEETLLHYEKQHHDPTENVPTPSPTQRLVPTTTTMKFLTPGVPHHYPQRVTYLNKDESKSHKIVLGCHQRNSDKQIAMEPYSEDNVKPVRVFRHGNLTTRQTAIELANNRDPAIKNTFTDDMRAYLLSYRKESGLSPSLGVIRQLSNQTGYSIISLKNFYKNTRQREKAMGRPV